MPITIILIIITNLLSILFGLILGIHASYSKIVEDKKFSWNSKFYKVKEINFKE